MVAKKKKTKVLELALVKYDAKKMFSTKKSQENFAVVVHVPKTTQ